MRGKGIVKEDYINGTFDGYTIDGIPVNKSSEAIAKENIGKEVEYEINYNGYRPHGMFNKEIYKKAKIIKQ
jgi:hypothetical protein